MSKHTPGPWVAVTRTNAHIEIEAPSQPGYSAKKVATVSLTNHEANARLIAAAPLLYEALKMAQFQIENQCDVGVDEWIACSKKVRAAIKAVEGEKT